MPRLGGVVLVLRAAIAALLLLGPWTALAGPDATRDALDRLQEILELRVDDGTLPQGDVLPAILVSATPRYEESLPWFGTRVLEVLRASLGPDLRVCEACGAPRAFTGEGVLAWQAGPVGIEEVVRLDERFRGHATPARSAIWVEEHQRGVAVRIVDLRTAKVLFAQNIDPQLLETRRTQQTYTLAQELDRRARGDSLMQGFADFVVYPRVHISVDWTDQWGPRNGNLTGVSLSLVDPVLGLGLTHFQRVPLANALVGGKVLVSVPTGVARSFGDTGEIIDPLLTGVGMVRVPFGRSNYGVTAAVTTNGTFGLGVSLLNVSVLPVIP